MGDFQIIHVLLEYLNMQIAQIICQQTENNRTEHRDEEIWTVNVGQIMNFYLEIVFNPNEFIILGFEINEQ